jgi:alpha,alpha-trehalase
MRKLLLTLSLFIAVHIIYAQNRTPRQQFPALFESVQLNDVFPDNKTFVDCTPKRDPAAIMKAYNAQKDKAGFNLKQFVIDNFIIPGSNGNVFKSDIALGIRKHIDTLWQVLYRRHDTVSKYSSLLALPNDFVIPGGRFRETYYWDSYFTMLGLQESHKTKIIQDMIGNFAYLLDTYGFIPNGTRTYYLTRSQPPFFSMMLDILARDEGEQVLVKYQPQMLEEYQFWMNGAEKLKKGEAHRRVVRMQGGEIMNRYYDDSNQPREESYKQDVTAARLTKQVPGDFYRNVRAAAESGWDFSTRWFDATGKLENIQTTDIIPIDLNCLVYHLELDIARSYQLQGNKVAYQTYYNKAQLHKAAILKYSWNAKLGWFMDYNWRLQQQTPQQTLAGTDPLEFKIATAQQAVLVANGLKTKFMKAAGLVTTFERSGQQWDSPNAWAPLQYMAIDGLNNYKQTALARQIAESWVNNNIKVFNNTGKLVEKYNVVDTDLKAGGGEYPLQDGFGWTNGTLLYLLNRYHFDNL